MEARIEVRPLAGALGAEIAGVDVSEALAAATLAALRAAIVDAAVAVLRDQ